MHVWDAETLEPLVDLEGHSFYVFAVAFSPDGERLVSGSGHGTVRVWDTLTVSERDAARKERDELVTGLRPRLRALEDRLGDWSAVADAVSADPELTEREREVALQEILGFSVGR